MSAILIIDNNLEYAQRLADAIESKIQPLVPTNVGVKEIIDYLLANRDQNIEAIYISAELTFAEFPRRSDHGGIQLVKHIRLSPELETLRLKPIAIGSWRRLEDYLRMDSGNAILTSPGVCTISLPLDHNYLLACLQRTICFESLPAMYSSLKDFFILTERDRSASEHDYRNFVGVARFMKELFGTDINDVPIIKDFENFRHRTLWLKKMEFHQNVIGQPILSAVSSDVLKKLKQECNKIKILLIDDEHRKGWSYTICRALVEDVSENVFQIDDHHINVANGRFHCIDSFDAALKYFGEQKLRLEDVLLKWSKSQSRLSHYQEEERKLNSELPTRLKHLEEKKIVKQKAVEDKKKKLEDAEKQVQDAESQLQQKEATFIHTYQDIVELLKNPSAINDLSEFQKTQNNHNRLMNEWYAEVESKNSILDEIQNLENELSELRKNQRVLSDNLEEAEHEYKQNLQDLISCLSHDLIFLDLRLEPLIDINQNISETSGIKLLQDIKGYDPSIPVIILTASQKAMSLAEALTCGAEGYWTKSISSASEFVAIVKKLINNISFRRCIWRKIRQVESKTSFRRYRVQRDATLDVQLVKESDDVQKVKTLLRECFAFMIQPESGIVQSITRLEPYEEIALRLGQIQEFRIYFADDIKKEEKGLWPALRKNNFISDQDDKIREYRNQAAHFYAKRFSTMSKVGSRVSSAQILEYFEYTLDSMIE